MCTRLAGKKMLEGFQMTHLCAPPKKKHALIFLFNKLNSPKIAKQCYRLLKECLRGMQ